MKTLNTISRIYNNGFPEKYTYYSIQDHYMYAYSYALNQFKKEAGALLETLEFTIFFYRLRKIKYELSSFPKYYNEIVNEENLTYFLYELDLKSQLFPRLQPSCYLIRKVLFDLREHTNSAFIECFKKEIIKDRKTDYCIVTKREMNQYEKEVLVNIFSNFKVSVMNEKVFNNQDKEFQHILFIGNEEYFHSSSNNSNCAKEISYICHDVYNNKFSDYSFFSDWDGNLISSMYKKIVKQNHTYFYNTEIQGEENVIQTSKDIPQNNIDQEGLHASAAASFFYELIEDELSEKEKKDLINVKLLELEDSSIIFLENIKSLKDIIDQNGKYQRKHVANIEEGDFLILNSLDEKIAIEEYANYIFKDKGIDEDRQIQKELKIILNSWVDNHSIESLSEIFKRKGLLSVNNTKILNLLKPSSFKLKNNKDFYKLLMIITEDNKRQADIFYQASKRLSAYHVRAGRVLRDIMRNKIPEINILKNIEKKVKLNIEKDFYINLAWSRVEKINNDTVKIPALWEGKVLNLNQLKGVIK